MNYDYLLKIKSETDRLEIARKYVEDKLSRDKIAKLYNVSNSTITRVLKNKNIKSRTRLSYEDGKVDIKFFDKLSSESLWVLGWFYTDGNVSTTGTSVSITVHRNDADVLQKISKLLKNRNNVIRESKASRANVLMFSSKILHDKLIELGCVPAKSLIIEFPNFLDKSNAASFLKGVFEGDGGFSLKKNNGYFTLKIASGSLKFVEVMKEKIKEFYNIDSHVYKHPSVKSANYLGFNIIESMKFLDLIYGNSTESVRMNRKYDLYLKCKKYYDDLPGSKNFMVDRQVKAFLKDINGNIYSITGLKKFAREFSVGEHALTDLVAGCTASGKTRRGWSIATQEEVDNAIKNNILVIKDYTDSTNKHYIKI
jgi:hypothetical protein